MKIKVYVGLKADKKQMPQDTIMYLENDKHPIEQWEAIKELFKKQDDFSIYTNSHIIIESIDVLAEYNHIQVKYYLFTNQELKSIDNNKLYIIYNDLSTVFDEIDFIKLKMEFKELCCCCNE